LLCCKRGGVQGLGGVGQVGPGSREKWVRFFKWLFLSSALLMHKLLRMRCLHPFLEIRIWLRSDKIHRFAQAHSSIGKDGRRRCHPSNRVIRPIPIFTIHTKGNYYILMGMQT